MKLKKFVICLICLLLVCGGLNMSFITNAAQYDSSPLQNAYYRLTHDKELTIGYIGGSITWGTGASNTSTTPWRALTTKWFKEQFPEAAITEKSMAIGGQGTTYALYRMEKALLNITNDLDLVFIETAINDGYDSVSGDTLRCRLESVVKKIYNKNKKCNIVFVITGEIDTMSNAHMTGTSFGTEHREIAEHYGIPVIDVGKVLYNKIYAENGNNEVTNTSNSVWKKYFVDRVHPSDNGYSVYAKTVADYLSGEIVSKNLNPNSYSDVLLPSTTYMKYKNLLIDAYDVDFTNFDFSGNKNFKAVNYQYNDAVYKSLVSENKDDTFTVKFKGTSFAIWAVADSVPTEIKYSVDGGKMQSLKLQIGSRNHRVYYLAENLDAGEHKIQIIHNDNKVPLDIRSMFIAGNTDMSDSVSFSIDAIPDEEEEEKDNNTSSGSSSDTSSDSSDTSSDSSSNTSSSGSTTSSDSVNSNADSNDSGKNINSGVAGCSNHSKSGRCIYCGYVEPDINDSDVNSAGNENANSNQNTDKSAGGMKISLGGIIAIVVGVLLIIAEGIMIFREIKKHKNKSVSF